tara:strand:- start:6064 stop:8193 length:2130 start_codon:yes stop_codon:yes gene_type:complete
MYVRSFIILSMVLAISLISCSRDEYPGPAAPEPGWDLSNYPPHDNIMPGPSGHIPTDLSGIQQQYEIDCIIEEWFFCPPLNAVWQFKIITDICKDQVLEVGECVEKFECDPSNASVEILECVFYGILGTQEKWCEKGVYKYSDCIPCEEEFCDGKDNDCDGEIDEDLPIQLCYNDCGDGDLICIDGVEECFGGAPEEEICDYKDNDCDGLIDEDQLNDCGLCGPLSDETCNGIDDDCDGKIDEDLVQECETVCENGLEFCHGGNWIGCTAQPGYEEVCNGFDDDCDGAIDEDLDCLCTMDMVGALFPCFEEPLVCGGGYKTCECVDEECTQLQLTPCFAQCFWQKPVPLNCDQLLGFIEPEMCNNHDDNCNQLVDEDLINACYTGPPETLYVGICLPGQVICEKGAWGNFYLSEQSGEVFIADMCLDEILPADKDACNGTDDNCDGDVDDGKEMQDTDILFIIDWSGSMSDEIQAVMTSLNMFASNYSDEEVIKWGVIIGPIPSDGDPNFTAWNQPEYLHLASDLVDFQQFMAALAALSPSLSGGSEMLYDAIYLSIHNLLPAASLPWPVSGLSWSSPSNLQLVGSYPDIDQFKINWRNDSNHVVIVFTDEEGQSYLWKNMNDPGNEVCGIPESELILTIQNAIDLSVYTFTPEGVKNASPSTWPANGCATGGWESLTQFFGKWYKLTSNAAIMYENLLEILDDTACSD